MSRIFISTCVDEVGLMLNFGGLGSYVCVYIGKEFRSGDIYICVYMSEIEKGKKGKRLTMHDVGFGWGEI